MPLPNQIRSARLTNASLASTIDDELANAEKALADILGIPIDTLITAALLRVAAGGLQAVVLQDLGAGDVTAAGEVGRKGAALRFHDGVAAKDVALGPVGFPAGTTMLFQQAAAPVGWTRKVDTPNTDATIILRLNNEAIVSGGSWVISGGSVGNHVLTIAEMPSHSHIADLASTGDGGTNIRGSVNGQVATANTRATGGGAGHVHPFAHDGAWRPKHVDVLVAIKD